ncbi:UBLCP1 [Acrasis kona]|uniref:UBLCP1 n=1 Tax=Acrasis kona TaxID=1008807 RepID=A0AAW2YV61_9EUKA
MSVQVQVNWLRGKTTLDIELNQNDTLKDLKQELMVRTNVRVDRMKLLGLKTAKNKTATHSDDTKMSEFLLTKGKVSIQLMGTPEKDVIEFNRERDMMFIIMQGEVEQLQKEIENEPENATTLKRCEEMLMQKLLQLDKMENLSTNARNDRKELIKHIQTVLDEIDKKKKVI